MPDLRREFFEILLEMASKDKKIILLTDDLGYSFCEQFQKKLPDQFINSGIMEQGTTGIAAGMALGGLKPYFYGGTLFVLMRNYEQVRDDIAFNDLNVKLCGTGANGFLGFSHNLTGSENEEDLLKNLPLKRFYPQNKQELRIALKTKKGAFIRL